LATSALGGAVGVRPNRNLLHVNPDIATRKFCGIDGVQAV
jgi:hypothetical protein